MNEAYSKSEREAGKTTKPTKAPVVSRGPDGKIGAVLIDTETGKPIPNSWVPKDDPKLQPYLEPGGKGGYKLDPQKFRELELLKKDAEEARKQAERLGDAPARETGVPRGQTSPTQQAAPTKPVPGADAEIKPAAKTYDVDGEKLTKAQINTRYNELRKQAGGLQPGSSAEKFGMSANQAIFGKNFAKPKTPNPMMKRYTQPSVEKEAYEVVLDYLLSEGHADTVEEAHYVMMQMDTEYVQSIVEGVGTYKDPVLGPHTPGGKAVRKIVKMGKAAVQGYQGSQAQGLNRLGGAIDAAQKEYQKKVEEQMMPPINPVAHNKLKKIRKAQELQNKTTGPESDAAGSAVKRLGGSGVNLPPV